MIIGIEEFLSLTNQLVIDMRTKEEYQSGHINDALNFEILNHEERKEVSILYNKGLNQDAYLLAYEYALDKLPELFKIIKRNKNKNIVFYCARGGSRSTIAYEVFKSLRAVNIYKVKDGYKSYRQFVNDYFENDLISYDLLTIYDNIGIDLPSELTCSNKYLLVDLRNKINSSGNPFTLLKANKDYLNSRMLNYHIFKKLYSSNYTKIVFILPFVKKSSDVLHERITELIGIGSEFYLSSTIEERVRIIKENYLVEDCTLKALIDFLDSKRKEISNDLVKEIIKLLTEKDFDKAIRLILVNYVDPMMNYFIRKNEIEIIKNMEEINEYLENWSE